MAKNRQGQRLPPRIFRDAASRLPLIPAFLRCSRRLGLASTTKRTNLSSDLGRSSESIIAGGSVVNGVPKTSDEANHGENILSHDHKGAYVGRHNEFVIGTGHPPLFHHFQHPASPCVLVGPPRPSLPHTLQSANFSSP